MTHILSQDTVIAECRFDRHARHRLPPDQGLQLSSTMQTRSLVCVLTAGTHAHLHHNVLISAAALRHGTAGGAAVVHGRQAGRHVTEQTVGHIWEIVRNIQQAGDVHLSVLECLHGTQRLSEPAGRLGTAMFPTPCSVAKCATCSM